MIEIVEPSPVALSKAEWNAVRRDHYGLDRPPMPLPAIQQLLGHADIATTTIYTRVSADDLARMMGTSEAL